jgi:hypothetical protein
MQLIDLNGTKKNFQSEFIFQTENPSKNVNICVLNQEELDNGIIKFEETQRGKYSKRITYQNDTHINHYIAVRKLPEDKDEKINASIVIHMKELSPIKRVSFNKPNEFRERDENMEGNEENEENEENNRNMEEIMNRNKKTLNPNMSLETKEKLKSKLNSLRNNKEYNNLENGNYNSEEDNDEDEDEDEDEEDKEEKMKLLLEERNKREKYTNSYFIIGILLLAVFASIFYIKKIRK